MIELTEGERDRVLIRFLYGTGARVSEVTALKWRDLQELAGGIHSVGEGVFGTLEFGDDRTVSPCATGGFEFVVLGSLE